MLCQTFPDKLGTSPRMWGTSPFLSCLCGSERRLIPTDVGNTFSILCQYINLSDHPHARGEHESSVAGIMHDVGSSPRMWGTLMIWKTAPPRKRIIPTHVGNTTISYVVNNDTADHPHACGEHSRTGTTPYSLFRIIPTHVGNTYAQHRRYCVSADHPHACGEHTDTPVISCETAGSSPRMWGTPLAASVALATPRIIPTHVGNTSFCTGKRALETDHPHACGEHGGSGYNTFYRCGSSPRMWGTQIAEERKLQNIRIIPTHVGNTISCVSFSRA